MTYNGPGVDGVLLCFFCQYLRQQGFSELFSGLDFKIRVLLLFRSCGLQKLVPRGLEVYQNTEAQRRDRKLLKKKQSTLCVIQALRQDALSAP